MHAENIPATATNNPTEFAEQLLRIGEGREVQFTRVHDDYIRVPDHMRVANVEELISFVYPNLHDPLITRNCGILAPKNADETSSTIE